MVLRSSLDHLSVGALMEKLTQLGIAAPVSTRPRSFPMRHTRQTDIALNAVIAAAVVVILLYVFLGPQA
jgi:hypothetical protein